MLNIIIPTYLLGENKFIKKRGISVSELGYKLKGDTESILECLNQVFIEDKLGFEKIFIDNMRIKKNIIILLNDKIIKNNLLMQTTIEDEDVIEILLQFAGG